MKVEFAPETVQQLGSTAQSIVKDIVDAKSEATNNLLKSIDNNVNRFCDAMDKLCSVVIAQEERRTEWRLEEQKRRLIIEEKKEEMSLREREVELERAKLDMQERKQRLADKDAEMKFKREKEALELQKLKEEK